MKLLYQLKILFLTTFGTWGEISFNIPTGIQGRITAIIIDLGANKDTLIWGMSNNGTFTTNSCYDLIDKSAPTQKKFNWICKLMCFKKIKHFFWLCHHNRLPCRYHLARIRMNINELSTICRKDTEDISHIFMGCFLAKKLWEQLGLVIKCPNNNDWLNYVRELAPCIPSNHISWSNVFLFVIWCIWLSRNNNNINNTSKGIYIPFILNQATQ